MALEGFKPLDLSSLQLQLPPLNLNTPINTGNIAKAILAGTNWNMDPAKSLDSNGKEAPHKKSFLGRIMDALSIGNYSMADASLEALKAHQSNGSDSVASDILKSIGGAGKGIAEGIGASLKGAFGTNAVANDPTGKNHFGDVYLQAQERGREALDPNSNMPLDERKDILKRAYLGGIPADIVIDPLNFIGLGEAKGAIKGAEAGKTAEQAVQKAEEIAKLSDLKTVDNVAAKLQDQSPLPVGSPINKIQKPVEPNNFDPETFDFVSATSGLPTAAANRSASIDSKLNGFVPSKVDMPPAVGRLGDPKNRQKIAGVMLRDLVTNGNWGAVRRKLAASFPGMELAQTNKYIDHLASLPNALEGLKRVPKNRVNFIGAIDRVLEHDFNQAGRASAPVGIPAESINTATQLPSKLVTVDNLNRISAEREAEKAKLKAGQLKPEEAKIRDDVINQFARQIETGMFPGVRNTDHFKQALESGKSVKWSGPKQVNMWNTILNRIPYAGEGKYRAALRILEQVENHFISKGHTPFSATRSAEAVPLRLSDVIKKIGPEKLAKHIQHSTTLLRSALAGGEMQAASGLKTAPTALSRLRDILDLTVQIEPMNHFWRPSVSRLFHSAKNKEYFIRFLENIGPENLSDYYVSSSYASSIERTLKLVAEEKDPLNGIDKYHPKVAKIIREVVAKTAAAEADAVKHGIDTGATIATAAKNSNQSEARIAEDINLATKTARDIAKLNGAGPVGSSIAGQVLKNIFVNKNPIESAINKNLINTKTALSTGKLGKFSNVPAVTHAIERVMDSPSPHSLGMQIGVANRAVDWLGARFNAAYKNPDINPIYNAQISTARSSVAKRGTVWNNTTRQYGRNEDDWNRAYLYAQNRFEAVEGSNVHAIGELIKQNFENLFGSSGLRAGAELENSVAGRSQLLMKELNANLRRYGIINNRFTSGKKVKDSTGAVHDYSNGIDWLHSWEAWDITDPLHFMMRVQNAVENTVREANVMNEIAARWGRNVKGNGFTEVVAHPRLEDLYFTPEYASQIKTYMHNLEELKKPNSKIMRQFDNVLSKWKSSVTIYMPSHHIRNVIGDTYMNWLAGVNTTKPYTTALRVMSSQKHRYDSIETVGKLTSSKSILDAIERARTGEVAGEQGTNIALTMRNGQHVTNDMIYTAMFQKGLLPSARLLEDITDDSTIIEKFRPLNGKGQAFFHHVSEYREHFIRIAHFVDVLKKSPKNFTGAVEDATHDVRKWHPDGLDLTKFERNVMRRIFPFYSWTRKAIPLTVESLVMAPGKVVLYPKVMGGLSEGLTGGYGTSDPFPTDQLFPQWIRDKGIGPVLGTSGNYTIINPSNPTLDLGSQFSDPIHGIGSMLNPAFRIPAEELTGVQMANKAPITSQADYITNQIPGFSNLSRVTNVGIGGPTAKWDKQGGPNVAALINLLTAAGVLNTGPYQKQAQFELRNSLGGK